MFSTNNNGRGNAVEIRFGEDDCDVDLINKTAGTMYEKKRISNSELYTIISTKFPDSK